MTGQGIPVGGSSSGYPGSQHRSYEDRTAHREQVMNNIRETSQQDRRVYVGNLSYDVKWHHLKDFMRQGSCLLLAAQESYVPWRIAYTNHGLFIRSRRGPLR